MKLFLAILAVNLVCLFWPGEAIANSDTVVVAFAVYGLTHIEWLMMRAVIWMNATATNLAVRRHA